MKLCCATDFTEPSRIAARGAARLAAKLDAELHLVHVAHLPGLEITTAAGAETVRGELERRRGLLAQLQRELRELGREPKVEVLEGLPDVAILDYASRIAADAIVVGPRGHRGDSLWNLGSIAIRVIKGATVPVLVLRDETSLAEWSASRRPLRVLVGTDPSQPEVPVLDFLSAWRRAGAIDLRAGHVYLPGEERTRAATAAHEAGLAACIREKLERWPELAPSSVRVVPGFGRPAEHLLELAGSEQADLIVVGTHRRHGMDRWIHGSVSLEIVGVARRNVLTLPLPAREPRPARPHPPEIRRALVPVDFSELSERAIRWAGTLVARGGTLQLLHVIAPQIPASIDFGAYVPLPARSEEEVRREHDELRRKLRELTPREIAEGGIETQIEIVTAFSTAEVIARAADRLESDVIVMPTHGRSGLSKALLGSVAQGVVRYSHVPVLIVPPQRP